LVIQGEPKGSPFLFIFESATLADLRVTKGTQEAGNCHCILKAIRLDFGRPELQAFGGQLLDLLRGAPARKIILPTQTNEANDSGNDRASLAAIDF
jgi:hypothetical protein